MKDGSGRLQMLQELHCRWRLSGGWAEPECTLGSSAALTVVFAQRRSVGKKSRSGRDIHHSAWVGSGCWIPFPEIPPLHAWELCLALRIYCNSLEISRGNTKYCHSLPSNFDTNHAQSLYTTTRNPAWGLNSLSSLDSDKQFVISKSVYSYNPGWTVMKLN